MADKKTEDVSEEIPTDADDAPAEPGDAKAADPEFDDDLEPEDQDSDTDGGIADPGDDQVTGEVQMPHEPDVQTYEELQAQVGELKDQLLRALAETENTRRRAQRDKTDASKFAVAGFGLAVQ